MIFYRKKVETKNTVSFNPNEKLQNVQLAEFNDWNPTPQALLNLLMVNGKYIVFKSGKYQYQIILDGVAINYDNPNSEPNGSGSINSVMNIINHIEKKPKIRV